MFTSNAGKVIFFLRSSWMNLTQVESGLWNEMVIKAEQIYVWVKTPWICHSRRNKTLFLVYSHQTCLWLWNLIELSTTQLKKKNTVTLEGWALNVSVAKQWQTAGRHHCQARLVKTSRFPTAMRSEMTNKILSFWQRGVSCKLMWPGRGLCQSIANCWKKC